MRPFIAAGAGFLLAVLWFDLMFDVQVRGQQGNELPDPVLASIAAYYRRVTTDARPRNRLIGLVMLGTIAATVAAIVRSEGPAWVRWMSLPLAVAPIGRAATRTFASAVRLGRRHNTIAEQTRLARAIYRDHLGCLAAIVALLVVHLAFG
jgi:hypothetical protein